MNDKHIMGTSPLESPSFRAQMMASVTALLEGRASLLAQVAKIDEQLSALSVLLGEAIDELSALGPNAGERPEPAPSTWPELIVRIISQRNGGWTTPEIVSALKGGPFVERYNQNPNALYNALGRLERSGRVVRQGKRTYLTEVFDRIQTGEVQEDSGEQEAVERAGMPSLIERVLSSHPNGINARGVIRALRNIPEGKEALERNPQVVYAALSRMVQTAALVRDERKLYRKPSYGPEKSELNGQLFDKGRENGVN